MNLYLAGPLFTQSERRWLRQLAQLLADAGHGVFLPQDDAQAPLLRDPPDFHGAFEQTEQSAGWARQNAACSYRALALRARDREGFPMFSLDLVCTAVATAGVGATVDCDGFMHRAPKVSEVERFDLNLAARGCPRD